MMGTDPHDETLSVAILEYIEYLRGTRERPVLGADVSEEERDGLEGVFAILEANWMVHVSLPPIESDPVALALGLTTAQATSLAISGSRVKELRQSRNTDRTMLASNVTAEGWDLSAHELSRIERSEVRMITNQQAQSLATALGVQPRELVSEAGHGAELLDWLDSNEIASRIASWAEDHGRDINQVRSSVQSRMFEMAARSRATSTMVIWSHALNAILEGME